jgi:hypothetical protein
MKCWNSAFNAQGFKSNYSSCTYRSSENIYVAAAVERCSGRKIGKTGWNSVYYDQNFVEGLSLGPNSFSFVTFSFLVMCLMPYYYAAGIWSFQRP